MGKAGRVQYRSLLENELLDRPVERLLSMLRFETKGKLEDLGLDIDPNTQKSGYLRFGEQKFDTEFRRDSDYSGRRRVCTAC